MKPEWLTVRFRTSPASEKISSVLRRHKLVTVCEEAQCPNVHECWAGESTATFMVLGDTCTRACKFCAVKTAKHPAPPDPDEPTKLAEAIAEIGLDYAVITSVDRDDLPDEGAEHFAACIKEIKKQHPGCIVEVLIPDFKGNAELIKKIVDAAPAVIAHNVETVERLQKKIRDPRAGYAQSLSVLETVKELDPNIFTKSSLMVGVGEQPEEIVQTMKDLRKINVDILTVGQYLKPKDKWLQVTEYVHPDQFKEYEKKGLDLGFKFVAAGPFVRSSYKAGELFMKNVVEKKEKNKACVTVR